MVGGREGEGELGVGGRGNKGDKWWFKKNKIK